MCVGVILRQKTAVFVVLLFVVFFALLATQALATEAPTHSILPGFQEDGNQIRQAEIQADIAEVPISFIANAGQADANVRFMVEAGKQTIFFTPNEVVFAASEQTHSREPRRMPRLAGGELHLQDHCSGRSASSAVLPNEFLERSSTETTMC